ncbi:MAG: ferredoxin [Methylobacter sp.]|nr:MAG: ferredoxin [Methylobacter sp.]PPD20197.1 MAG: ferredoxin [Methylobacter sp.]
MPKPLKHVFVCTQTRPPNHPRGSCGTAGCAPVFQAFAQQFEQRKLFDQYALTSSGCLGACQTGPSILVYPDGVMYANVTTEDVTAIIDEHLLQSKPVERLLQPQEVWS